MIGSLSDDLHFAVRFFMRRRGFALLLVTTLALGIGAATAMFSLVDGVLWKPLPYRGADRLHWIARTQPADRAHPMRAPNWDRRSHTLPDYFQWSIAQRSFEATAAWSVTNEVVLFREGTEQIRVGRATSSLLPMLGAVPAMGRWFLPGEDGQTAAPLAVLSHAAWQRRFGSDSGIIGRTVTIRGLSHVVIGVLPPEFRVIGETSQLAVVAWTPAGSVPAVDWTANNFNFRVVGRLRSDVARSAAADEAARLLATPRQGEPAGIRLEHALIETTRGVRQPLQLLVWSAVILLLVACGNVAILLIGESSSRSAEVATRVSLGASAGRVVRQILTENLLLGALGSFLGILLALGGVRSLRAIAPANIPRIESAHVDLRGVAFAVVISLAVTVLFSLAPIVAALRTAPASVLRAGSARGSSGHGRAQRWGVAAQCALVVVLLVGAALLIETHRRLLAVDPGFRASEVLGLWLRLPMGPRYGDAERRRALFEELQARARSLPGVIIASAASSVPFQGLQSTDIRVAASPAVGPEEILEGPYIVAAMGLFETLGIPLRTGRFFDDTDRGPGNSVIVSEAMARRLWPRKSAIGERILLDRQWRVVVGVVGDVRHQTLDENPRMTFYAPAAQTDRWLDYLAVRTTGSPLEALPALRRVIAEIDPGIAIASADRISDRVSATLVGERFRTMLFVCFAATAILIAAVGIYGVATETVGRRTKEIAIRMAVGAAPRSVFRLIVAGMVSTAAVGAAIGAVLSLAATRALQPFLFDIARWDPASYLAVLGFVLAVAALAALLPAARAARIDLMTTLRAE